MKNKKVAAKKLESTIQFPFPYMTASCVIVGHAVQDKPKATQPREEASSLREMIATEGCNEVQTK